MVLRLIGVPGCEVHKCFTGGCDDCKKASDEHARLERIALDDMLATVVEPFDAPESYIQKERGFGLACPTCKGTGHVDGDKKTCDCVDNCFCMRGSRCPECHGRTVVDVGSTVHEAGCTCGFCCKIGSTKA